MMQVLGLLVMVGAVVGAGYTLLRPQWAFVLVLLLFPIEQLLQVYVPVLTSYGKVVNYAIGTLALAAVMLRLGRREPTLMGYGNRVTGLTLCLYIVWAVGILYSPSREMLQKEFGTALAYQILWMAVLPLLLIDIYEFRRMLPGLMLVGGVISVLVILNPSSSYHSGRLVLDLGTMEGRVSASGNPLALAEMGGLIALVAALFRPAKPSQLVTVVRMFAFVAGMGVAIGSGSRGQVLAAGLAGILFFPVSRRLANPKQFVLGVIGFGVLVVGLLIVFKLFIGAQNEERWDPVGMLRDTTGRLDMVWNLLEHYLASPASWLFGLGTQAYASISPDEATYVHNLAAEILCEHGLVGAAIFVLITGFTIKAGAGLWRMYRDDPSMRATIAILLAICLFYLLQSLKQGSMSTPSPFYWWIILAKFSFHETKLVAMSPAAPVDAAALEDAQPDEPLAIARA